MLIIHLGLFSFTLLLVPMVRLSGSTTMLHLEGVEGVPTTLCFLFFSDGVEGFTSAAFLFLPFFGTGGSPLFFLLFCAIVDPTSFLFAQTHFLSLVLLHFFSWPVILILSSTLEVGATTSLVDGATVVTIAKFPVALISLDPQALQINSKKLVC
jgi:hypothetical protein